MVSSCVAFGCTERAVVGEKWAFYLFYSDRNVKTKWLPARHRRGCILFKTAKICSDHFTAGDCDRDPKAKKCKLKPEPATSVFPGFPGYLHPKKAKMRWALSRCVLEETPLGPEVVLECDSLDSI